MTAQPLPPGVHAPHVPAAYDPELIRARGEAEAGRPRGYVAVGWQPWGKSATSLLAVGGKIVLFDTKEIARNFLPYLGQGRFESWTPDGETLTFTPMVENGINKCTLVTDYDPYNLPAQMPGGIRSETRLKEWRSHIMFSHAFLDCGQHETKDGVRVNPLLSVDGVTA